MERFLREWDAATHPQLEGRPILRIALLDPARTPVVHRRVEGVPDDVLAAYYDKEQHEEMELAALVAEHGGVLHEIPSRATSLAMTRLPEGGYEVDELDADGHPTEFETRYETLDDALRMSALTYGHPPGTLTWQEVLGND
jgi:hypothetical protein